MYVTRRQFPIRNSYAITAHSSQGLSLDNVVADAGNTIFADGQTYKILSRVKKLERLHLINFDPSGITANKNVIVEYNRLRNQYRRDLQMLNIPDYNKSNKLIKVRDSRWTVSKSVEQVQQDNYLQNMVDNVVFLGILNRNNSTYATSCIQCLINCKYIRQIMTQQKEKDIFHQIYHAYASKSSIDIKNLCQFVNAKYLINGEYDAAKFLEDIFLTFKYFDNIVNYQLNIVIRCPGCDLRVNHQSRNRIFKLS